MKAIRQSNGVTNYFELKRDNTKTSDTSMLQNFYYLREFDGGGSGDDGVAEKLGNKGQQAIFVGEVAVAEGPQGAAEIDS